MQTQTAQQRATLPELYGIEYELLGILRYDADLDKITRATFRRYVGEHRSRPDEIPMQPPFYLTHAENHGDGKMVYYVYEKQGTNCHYIATVVITPKAQYEFFGVIAHAQIYQDDPDRIGGIDGLI